MSVLSNVSIPSQDSTRNLCWAAVTIGVCVSLGDPPLSLGAVAARFFEGCTGDPTSKACDHTHDLADAISSFGHRAVSTGNPMIFSDLQQQIDRPLNPVPVPVLMLIGVNTHACLIKGCVVVNGVEQIVLLNPSDANPTDHFYDFDAFFNGTTNVGEWQDSYLVS